MKSIRRPLIQWALYVSSGAALFQFGGCFENLGVYANNFNPCGTILNCDPADFVFQTSGYQGPGFDPDVDLTCTFPPFCLAQDTPNDIAIPAQ